MYACILMTCVCDKWILYEFGDSEKAIEREVDWRKIKKILHVCEKKKKYQRNSVKCDKQLKTRRRTKFLRIYAEKMLFKRNASFSFGGRRREIFPSSLLYSFPFSLIRFLYIHEYFRNFLQTILKHKKINNKIDKIIMLS